MHEYKMNSHIIKLSTDEDLRQFLKTAKYLKDVYLQFIYPMEDEIRSKLLMKYKIINEGELFCSDFRYRVTEGKPLDFIGMISKSNEETQIDINKEIDEIIEKYRKTFTQFTKDQFNLQEESKSDKDQKKALAVFRQKIAKVLYFGSYFHRENHQSKIIEQKLLQMEDAEETQNDDKENIALFKEFAEIKIKAQ